MKARLVPIYFKSKDEEFDIQLGNLKSLLIEEAEFLKPVELGDPLPQAEAVVFPQLLGDAYRHLADFKLVPLPILIITSEFGTVSMWDWEIASYLRSEGVETIAPYNLVQTQMICRALSVRRTLKQTRFLVFQNNPGKGFQASIFKRFYWWEDECTQRIVDRFGISLEKKSFKELAARAKAISDRDAETVIENREIRNEGVSSQALNSAVKLYLAVKQELDQDNSIRAVGINCLNESHFSDTTPCLAWNLLYEEQGLLWGCEADTMSMLSEYILHESLGAPVMMTNLYPFLMGQAALKHEHIPEFPQVPEPEDCILLAHCGYLGVLPESFSTHWTLKPKVLAIVDENATAIDARLPLGQITLAKISPTLDRLTVISGNLEGYVQYSNSDCLNGAIIRIKDGRRSIKRLDSHHYVILTGDHLESIALISKIFGLQVEEI
jgi:hypothetical protein